MTGIFYSDLEPREELVNDYTELESDRLAEEADQRIKEEKEGEK